MEEKREKKDLVNSSKGGLANFSKHCPGGICIRFPEMPFRRLFTIFLEYARGKFLKLVGKRRARSKEITRTRESSFLRDVFLRGAYRLSNAANTSLFRIRETLSRAIRIKENYTNFSTNFSRGRRISFEFVPRILSLKLVYSRTTILE